MSDFNDAELFILDWLVKIRMNWFLDRWLAERG